MAVAGVDMVSRRTMSPHCAPVNGGNTVRMEGRGVKVSTGDGVWHPDPFSKSAMLWCRVTLKTCREINHQFTHSYSNKVGKKCGKTNVQTSDLFLCTSWVYAAAFPFLVKHRRLCLGFLLAVGTLARLGRGWLGSCWDANGGSLNEFSMFVCLISH